MKTLMWPALVGLFLIVIPVAARADEDTLIPGTKTEIEITGLGIAGPHNKAKFYEYRDLPQGGVADWIWLNHENKEKSYFLDVRLKDAAQEDMNLQVKLGEYGQWRLEFGLDRIPHRFMFDAITIFQGLGTRNVRVQDAHQIALQGALAGNPSRVLSDLEHEADTVEEIALERDKYHVKLDWIGFDPITFSLDLSHEERSGDRPFMANFGFGNALQIAEPVDYGTSDLTFRAMYDQDALHLAFEYGFSIFDDRNDVLNYDNPFRFDSTTAAAAYTFSNQGGSRYGRHSLPPDSIEHHFTFEAGVDLPYKTRVNANFTYTFGEDDVLLQPYTVNSAVTTGAVSGVAGILVPFDATKRVNLPQQRFDGRVDTEQFSFQVVNRAIEPVELRAKYRLYNFENGNDHIEFPGFVRADGVWEPEEIDNDRVAYIKHQLTLEGAIDVGCKTTVTPGYRLDYINRDERETTETWEHTLLFTVDSHPCDFVQARTSYEHTWRANGAYDFRKGEDPTEEPRPGVLPYLRMFDQADKQRDKVNVQFTFFPVDWLTPTAGYTLLWDHYDSDFGLTSDIRHAVNFGFDTDPTDWLKFEGYAQWEWANTEQAGRQWSPSSAANPAGPGDPYVEPLSEFNFGNWEADSFNRVQSVNFNSFVNVMKDKLDVEGYYTHSVASEHISMDSPIGTTLTDANARGLVDWSNSDNYTWDLLKFQIVWHIRKNLSATFGYIWEDFDRNNARYRDYVPVGINKFQVPTQGYTAWYGLGVDNDDYTAHTGFCTVNWKF